MIYQGQSSLLKRNLHIVHVGVYGDVQRVKILYNKKDSALIQMAEPHQALLGECQRTNNSNSDINDLRIKSAR